MSSVEQETKQKRVGYRGRKMKWKPESITRQAWADFMGSSLPQMFTHTVEMQPLSPGGGSMFHNNSLHNHKYSNEDFIVIISCCSVPHYHRDMLCANPLSAAELFSLMNLSEVNDSGSEYAVYQTGRRLVWAWSWCPDTVGEGAG